jgi:hypothetical protein
VGLWTTQERCPQAPQAQQQQKRTIDVLQSADIFTRYGHTDASAVHRNIGKRRFKPRLNTLK